MQQTINTLFSNGTVEDEHDALVLGTLWQQIVAKVPHYNRIGGVRLYDYCLGVSIDVLYAALPKTGGIAGHLRPALTIYELIASVGRLTDERAYVCNTDTFQVIHLGKELIYALTRELLGEADDQVVAMDMLASTCVVTLADRESRLQAMFAA